MKRLATILVVLAGLVTACQGNVFSLEIGQCFDDTDETGEVSEVPIVDCDEPHDNEVYHLFDVAGSDYPGDDAVQEQAGEQCLNSFESYVNSAYAESEFYYGWLTPTSGSWDGGDREVVCILFADGEQVAGSARNSGR